MTSYVSLHSATDPLSSADRIASLIATARQLRQTASTRPLRGRNLALLRPDVHGEPSRLQHAAEEIGARVAVLKFSRPSSTSEGSDEIGRVARLLGRMYDGIDCYDLQSSVQRLIELHAGIPVFAGLELDSHPARVIADLWTLCERQAPAQQRIVFIGNDHNRRARMFLAAARAMGMAILVKAQANIVEDETLVVADATRPGKWGLSTGGAEIDDESVQENHRRVMQAVLIDTLHCV